MNQLAGIRNDKFELFGRVSYKQDPHKIKGYWPFYPRDTVKNYILFFMEPFT